ncbi:cupin domain-containing protein [Fulvivirgaceae bacterium BMA10]|uniref:Cupin domain-containing protein n=1 Tax=Splendidivirga corallicola TaxID=3051826 RepID=A0ABT8KQ67_9BACT|nr:cupin domain-containing protein [Fulvivirgaceae bacterium BMA10]
MKTPIQKTAIPDSKTFLIHELTDPYFDPNWHFHKEYQLFVVLKGTGTRFIGNNISHFEPGDMVFTGSNLPHVWRSDEQYFKDPAIRIHGIVVYFSEEFMGNIFLNKEEMINIKELFQRSNRGLDISGATKGFVLGK